MSLIYDKVNDPNKEEKITEITYTIFDKKDNSAEEIFNFMIDILIQKSLYKETVITGMAAVKFLYEIKQLTELEIVK